MPTSKQHSSTLYIISKKAYFPVSYYNLSIHLDQDDVQFKALLSLLIAPACTALKSAIYFSLP